MINLRYPLTKNFTKLSETSGTIQNSSKIYAVEISDNPQAGSGFLLYPLNKISFTDKQLYARCAEVAAVDVYVVPFVVDMGVAVGSSSGVSAEGFTEQDLDDIFKD